MLHHQKQFAGAFDGGDDLPTLVDRVAQRHLAHGVHAGVHCVADDGNLLIGIDLDHNDVHFDFPEHLAVVGKAGDVHAVLAFDVGDAFVEKHRPDIADGGKFVFVEGYDLSHDVADRAMAQADNPDTDLPEVLGVADRVLVMREGNIVGELGREEATEEEVLKLALPSGTEQSVPA